MLWFQNDYSEGAHPQVLQHLIDTNMEKLSGYGTDAYCASATEKIRAACECPDAQVFYISGGTQTNAVVISTMLKSYEAVVAAKTGHVNFHEAGAIEYTGHKVLEVPSAEGKIIPEKLAEYTSALERGENRRKTTTRRRRPRRHRSNKPATPQGE